ncbi:hypothetical protein [Methanoculleus sp. 10]|jgi:hypothetical protein|uniref:hypothetical protein n=1 Tax=Methanoculleus sp. 10 TaxID=430615 RepID=UPI001B743511|nr:hypothetical protein [Methanoculleus sp. 10]MBP7410156.1 hypothetical protein [Methanoculleus sp.]
MMTQEYRQIRSELATLEKMLTQLPKSSVIERMSLEARKEALEDALASQETGVHKPFRINLTFRGKPIVGNHGVFADFGGTAVREFADAVAAIGASQSEPLGSRGVIPKREEYQMLITGTATGSFGFVLEETSRCYTLTQDKSLLELAVDKTMAILKASVGTDEELSEAVSEADPRALKALRDFLNTLSSQEAVCALESRGETFRFSDVGQVACSASRLSEDNIREEDMELRGQFLGVLPNRRTFEFHITDSAEIITGKVGAAIEDAGSINGHLNQPVTIKVHTKRVGVNNPPKYVLFSYEAEGGREDA